MSVLSARFWLLGQSPWLRKVSYDIIGHIIKIVSPHWTEETTQCLQVLDAKCGGHADTVWDVSWSPDNKFLASGSDDDTIRIWALNKKTNKFTCIQVLDEERGGGVDVVSWSPDGQTLASGSDNNTVRIWKFNKETNKLEYIQVLNTECGGHTNWVWSVNWSPDGQRLASGSDDKTIRIWTFNTELNKLECVQVLDESVADIREVYGV